MDNSPHCLAHPPHLADDSPRCLAHPPRLVDGSPHCFASLPRLVDGSPRCWFFYRTLWMTHRVAWPVHRASWMVHRIAWFMHRSPWVAHRMRWLIHRNGITAKLDELIRKLPHAERWSGKVWLTGNVNTNHILFFNSCFNVHGVSPIFIKFFVAILAYNSRNRPLISSHNCSEK
jgi:hypothetical protein